MTAEKCGFTVVLLIFSLIINVSYCGNDYGGCKPEECEVRAVTESGCVCGRLRYADDGTPYESYRGVPYGRPPLEERRFRELEPVVPWDGDYDATEDSAACPQSDFVNGRTPLQTKDQSEDCIYLNLHSSHSHVHQPPYSRKKILLPVLIFVHGGTLQSGSGLTDSCGPEYLMSRPVVVITFNYRLNVFGFLSLGTKEIPGNQGYRDILTLLKWVQRNVAAFGGDPNNVTVMGQSAGATAVHMIALSKAAIGLFKRIILMSCTAFPNWFTTSPKYARDVAAMFLQEVGINSTDPVSIHKKLVHMPLLKIMEANTAVQYKTALNSFNPVIEEIKFPGMTRVVEEDPLTLIAKGRGRQYPSIVSFTNNEMHYARWLLVRKNILGLLEKDPTAIVQPRLLYSLPKDEILAITTKIYERYFDNGIPTLKRIMDYYTDLIFKHAAFKLAQWKVALGGAPMYIEQYSYKALRSVIKEAHWVDYEGAAHADDLAFVFRVNSLMGNYSIYPPRYRDDIMKSYMVYLITNFMTDGNPLRYGPEGGWPPVSKGKIDYYDITKPLELGVTQPTKEQLEMVEFFDSIDPETRYITTNLGAGWY